LAIGVNDKQKKVIELCAEKNLFYLEFPFEFPQESVDEVKQVYDEGYFVKHRGGDSHGWWSCALHGWGTGKRAEYYRTMNPSGYDIKEEDVKYGWTELEEVAPRTKEFLLDHFDCSIMRRARFMLLEPGGEIKAHTDRKNRNIWGAINCCMTQPKNCYLRRTDTLEPVPFKPRKIFFYDNGVEHEAANNSKENRFHFIIHGYTSNKTKELFVKAYEDRYGPVEL